MKRPVWLNIMIPLCAVVASLGIIVQVWFLYMVLMFFSCAGRFEYGFIEGITSKCFILSTLCVAGLIVNLLLFRVAFKFENVQAGAIRFAYYVFGARFTFSALKLALFMPDSETELSYFINATICASMLFDIAAVFVIASGDKSPFALSTPGQVVARNRF